MSTDDELIRLVWNELSCVYKLYQKFVDSNNTKNNKVKYTVYAMYKIRYDI